jgi:predicted dehydrogenase
VALRVAIVGCGLIGQKRAQAMRNARLVAAADTVFERAARLAAQHPGCAAVADWRACVARPDVDAVIVSTINASLAEVTLHAVEHGKHVLVEKPAARSARELESVVEATRRAGVVVKVGFNHRVHPAFGKARELFDARAIGPALYVRARYGHGGRIGYDREWRADPTLAGGGELLDQGVHLIDLARWFLGDFAEVSGHIDTFFWDMPVEDNGFLLLKTHGGRVAWLHASCTEWKNLFSFELFGRDGKLQVDGLGGSYGIERLTYYRMLPQMGPPETTMWEFPGPDTSWELEFADFSEAIAQRREPQGTLHDALAALRVIGRVYEQAAPLRAIAPICQAG